MKSKNKNKKRIFLDYASITPVSKEIAVLMQKISLDFWANPSSIHQDGEVAKNLIEESRKNIANYLQCKSSEVIFTGSGTESLNTAIFGVVKGWEFQNRNNKTLPHIITSKIEHSAVLRPIEELLKENRITASFIEPNSEGLIDPISVEKKIKENTIIIAIQHSNNEIGAIEPINKIALIIKKIREKNKTNYPYFMVDASQSFLYENISLESLKADILILDGIKMYGPRGIGILVLKRWVKLEPLLFGGGQEFGLRSGTENLPAIVGLSKAFDIAVKMRFKESQRLKKLRDYLANTILKEIKGASINGSMKNRLPNNLNICFQNIDAEFLVIKLDLAGFSVSSASACQTLSLENSSYVIDALGKNDCKNSSLRFSFGRETQKNDLDLLVKSLKKLI